MSTVVHLSPERITMRIAEIYSRDVACIDAEASVRLAASEMRRHHVGCMIVVDRRDAERIPRGIVTDRDIVMEVVAPGIDPESLTVADVMARQPATCREDDKLFDAIDTMRVRGVRRLPVIGVRGQLIGVVSADDIMSALGMCLRELWQVGARGVAREIETRA
jgi:CBS domain-containing protein